MKKFIFQLFASFLLLLIDNKNKVLNSLKKTLPKTVYLADIYRSHLYSSLINTNSIKPYQNILNKLSDNGNKDFFQHTVDAMTHIKKFIQTGTGNAFICVAMKLRKIYARHNPMTAAPIFFKMPLLCQRFKDV